jgi:uncharacterized membrane protein
MSDLEDYRWSNAVVDGLRKSKYYDVMLILSIILAFILLIIISASST